MTYTKKQNFQKPRFFPQLISEKTETGTQTIDSSSECIDLGLKQASEMEPAVDGTPADELTFTSVEEKIKHATDPILRREEELSALLASRTEMKSTGNSEASGSGRNRESSSPSRNRYDTNQRTKSSPIAEHGPTCSKRIYSGDLIG